MSLNYVVLTLDLFDGQGNPVTQGWAALTPSATLTDTADNEIVAQAPIVAQFRSGLTNTVSLLATDNGALAPSGWGWNISFTGVPGSPAGFSFFLPFSGGAAQRLSHLSPVSSVTAMQAYMPLPSGTPAAGQVPVVAANGSTATQWGAGVSNRTPATAGAARPGTGTSYSRDDHVHELSNPTVAAWLAQASALKQLAHRGGRAVYPENALESYRICVEQMTSAGMIPAVKTDAQWMADNSNMVMHDSTANRTCVYASGAALPANDTVNTYTIGSLEGIRVNAPLQSGPAWPLVNVPTLAEVLDELGGKCVLFIEPKTGIFNQLVPVAKEIVRRGLQDSVVFVDNQSAAFNMVSTLTAAGITGIACQYVWNSVPVTSPTPAQIIAAGYAMLAIGTNYTDTDITTVVNAAHAAGLQTQGFPYTSRYDQTRMAGLGIDTHASDDPVYTSGLNVTMTADHINRGAMISGMYDVQLNNAAGLSWFGGPGFYRAGPGTVSVSETMRFAQVAPLPYPAFTMTGTVVVENPDSDTSRWFAITCSALDFNPNGFTTGGYQFFMRQNGGVQLARIDPGAYQGNGTFAGGTSTVLTSGTGNAQTPVTTNGALTSGVPVTSITILAAAAAIPSGAQYMLPTGQVATTSASALAGATSISVNSITPSATVASGSLLGAVVPFTISRTSAGLLTFTVPGKTLTATDTTYQPLYPWLSRTPSGASGLAVSVSGVAVTNP